MANPEHIKWLLEGVDAWNRRRVRDGFVPDLADAKLNQEFKCAGKLREDGRIPLTSVDFSKANLANVDLVGADLAGAGLSDADLRGAELAIADFTGATFAGANLTRSTLDGADLTSADLTGANLSVSKLWKARLYDPFNPVHHSPSETSLAGELANIGGLLSQIRKLKKHHKGVVLYFRGEPKNNWKLQPSIFRDGLAKFERDMLIDLVSRRPEEFGGMDSALEQWVLARHHGLSTRFVDVTKNPLVGLFYACEKKKENAGILKIFAVPRSLIKPFNSDTISIIANLAKLSRDDQNLLLGKSEFEFVAFISSHKRRYSEAMDRLYQLIQSEKANFTNRIDPRDFYRVFIVEPQQSLERIRAQSAAFIISAFHERFEKEEILKWNNEIPVYAHYDLVIPGNCKDALLEELRLLNITRETLFPGLDASADAVMSFHSDRYSS